MNALFHKIIHLFTRKQTYLNLLYLGMNVILGFAYYITWQVCLALAWGLTFPILSMFPSLDWVSQIKVTPIVLGGVLIIPILVWILQLFVVPEQWLANLLLQENIALDRKMWSKDSSLLSPGRLFLAASTWKRLVYMLLKIPLGGISFFALFTVLIPVTALFAMPLAYLAGFQNLIIGPWRFDSFGKTILALLAGILLMPLTVYALNMLAKLSGWMARSLLPDVKV